MSSTPTAAAPTTSYVTSIAHTSDELRAAQRLRHQIFTDEIGAQLHTALPGHDTDEFDEAADHVIVTHTPTDEVVGTYRLLPPGRAQRLYSENEFDLGSLADLRGSLLEAGRSCVHPEHRSGAVINLMWAAVARYALLSGLRYLGGCGSVSLADGGLAACTAWRLAAARHSSPADLRVRPHNPWLPTCTFADEPRYVHLPPLLRGYLRIGAWVCGPPAHDPDFNVADFFVLLPLQRIDERYLQHLLGNRR